MSKYNAKSLSVKELNTRIYCTKRYIKGLVEMRTDLKRTTSKARYKLWSESYTYELRRARHELKQYLKERSRKVAILEEIKAIEKLVRDFATQMRLKLLEKMFKGWGGWNEPDKFPTKNLEDKLKAHIAKGFDIKNMVDIGNFVAMIWWRREKELIERMAKTMFSDGELGK